MNFDSKFWKIFLNWKFVQKESKKSRGMNGMNVNIEKRYQQTDIKMKLLKLSLPKI